MLESGLWVMLWTDEVNVKAVALVLLILDENDEIGEQALPQMLGEQELSLSSVHP